jgi:hypothetical protein
MSLAIKSTPVFEGCVLVLFVSYWAALACSAAQVLRMRLPVVFKSGAACINGYLAGYSSIPNDNYYRPLVNSEKLLLLSDRMFAVFRHRYW